MYSCADDGMHTAELEEQSRQSTPIFAIGTVTYPRMRGGSGVLEQVGYFGHDDFNLGILLHGSCRICGGRKCWHSHVAASHATDSEGDTYEIPDEMWGWGHLLEFLQKPSLPNIWTDAIFEFMSLIEYRLHGFISVSVLYCPRV
jgi:hypothetical protein